MHEGPLGHVREQTAVPALGLYDLGWNVLDAGTKFTEADGLPDIFVGTEQLGKRWGDEKGGLPQKLWLGKPGRAQNGEQLLIFFA